MSVLQWIVISIFFLYLILTAIIDSKKRIVYCYLNYAVATILGLYIIIAYGISIPILIGFVLFYLVFFLSEKMSITGGGDTEVFGVCYLGMVAFCENNLMPLLDMTIDFLVALLICVLLAKVIHTIKHKKNDKQKQEKIAFCPYIALAMFVAIIVYQKKNW